MSSLKQEPVTAIQPDADRQPGHSTRGRKIRQSGNELFVPRNIRMLCEMGWLTLAMTVQLYVPETKGYLIVCGLLAAYMLVYSGRAERVSGVVWFFSFGLALGSFGGLATGDVTDLYQPLHLALCSLAIMGFFVSEYNREEDARFIGGIIVVLLPLAAWQSITRNGLADEWTEGGRRGVNLIALFLMLAASYGFLLKGRWKLVALPMYAMLFLLGSRTALITALALPVIYCGINRTMRQYISRNTWSLSLVIGVFLIAILCQDYFAGIKEYLGGAMGQNRFEANALKEGSDQRLNLTLEWLKYLWDKPTWFGHGIYTYGVEVEYDHWPHEGILHVFNGFGVICGSIYLWACIRVASRLWRKRAFLPPHISWAAAFFAAILIRALGEAQLIVHSIHISGFAVTYGTGLAIWGAERYGQNISTKRKKRFHGRIQSNERPANPKQGP